jgi:hypothetical protein
MTKLLQDAFDIASALPEDRQNEIGEIILSAIEQERSPLRLSPAQLGEVERRRREQDDFATDAEVQNFYRDRAG